MNDSLVTACEPLVNYLYGQGYYDQSRTCLKLGPEAGIVINQYRSLCMRGNVVEEEMGTEVVCIVQ